MKKRSSKGKIGKRFHPPGTSPGTLVPQAPGRGEPIRITFFEYGPEAFTEKLLPRIEDAFVPRDRPTVTWIDVAGPGDTELLRKLGEWFGLHPLALEDVVNTGQRPKLDNFGDSIFVVTKQAHAGDVCRVEQVSLFLGRNYVLSIQEDPIDPFEPVRERIRRGKGRIRSMGADYLAYALIDSLIDGFFPVLEQLGERVERVEDALVERAAPRTLQEIHQLKRELLLLRRAAWPQREVISALQREDVPFVQKETRVYLRDCYDHVVQIMDIIETYRELAAGMLDVYLSSQNNRMNEVMKVLTIISTIFIPLNFMAGIYGMNFNTEASRWNMPELNNPLGYPLVLGAMGAVAIGMLLFFRRRGWFD